MKPEAAEPHTEPAQLDAYIGTPAQAQYAFAPDFEHFVASLRVFTDPDRTSGVIHNNRGVGKRLRQVDDVIELWMVCPTIEAQAQRGQARKSPAQPRIQQQMRWNVAKA